MADFDPISGSTYRQPQRTTSDIISHAWDNYKKTVLYGILVVIVTAVLSSILNAILQRIMGIDSVEQQTYMQEMISRGDYNVWVIPGLSAGIAASGVVGLLLYPMYAGYLYVVHKANHGEAFAFSDLFIGYRHNTANLILYSLIAGILTGIGLFLCVIPGIVLWVMFFIGMPVVFFENASAVDGIKKSFDYAKANFGVFFLTAVASFFISIAGVLLCGIGLIATAPFMIVAMYSAYSAFAGTPVQIKQV